MSRALAGAALALALILVIGNEMRDLLAPPGEEITLRGALTPYDGMAILEQIGAHSGTIEVDISALNKAERSRIYERCLSGCAVELKGRRDRPTLEADIIATSISFD